MSTHKKLDRRQFFERALMVGAATFGAGAFLSACKKDANGSGGGKTPPATKTDCTDISALSETEKGTRTALKYVDKSPEAAKNCANCKLFVEKKPCNSCTAVPGPIAAQGWCSAWVAKG